MEKRMTTSEKGRELIKRFEGCRLRSYKCPAGVWTIGYGHTKGVTSSMVITGGKADELLKDDLKRFEDFINDYVTRQLKQCEFDALVSFCFNLGPGNAIRLLKDAETDDIDAVTERMMKYINANGKPLLGLKKRREAEAKMYRGEE